MNLELALRRLVTDLRAIDARFTLVGGLAVSTRAEPRMTRDLDVAVTVADDAEAEAIIRQMIGRGYQPEAVIEQYANDRLSSVRLRHYEQPMVFVDLLFASSGIEAETVAESDDREVLPGLELPVASVGHLIAMKLLARDDRERPADADDLRELAAVARATDWDEAAEAVRLITERGFDRGRDLVAGLGALQAEPRGPRR